MLGIMWPRIKKGPCPKLGGEKKMMAWEKEKMIRAEEKEINTLKREVNKILKKCGYSRGDEMLVLDIVELIVSSKDEAEDRVLIEKIKKILLKGENRGN